MSLQETKDSLKAEYMIRKSPPNKMVILLKKYTFLFELFGFFFLDYFILFYFYVSFFFLHLLSHYSGVFFFTTISRLILSTASNIGDRDAERDFEPTRNGC